MKDGTVFAKVVLKQIWILLVIYFISGCAIASENASKSIEALPASSKADGSKIMVPTGIHSDAVGDPTGIPSDAVGDSGSHTDQNTGTGYEQTLEESFPVLSDSAKPSSTAFDFINPEGMNLEQRVNVPKGYARTDAGGFGKYIREYPLKEHGAAVLLHDGREKANQSAHVAVFALPLGERDLQQCADSIMRLYAEYQYANNQAQKIGFHFVSGFYADYATWRSGKRIQVNGNVVKWVSSKGYDDSYPTFEKYLTVVFAYSSTLSMEGESKPISLSEAQIGDFFLRAGSPGHVVMIADISENADGKKAFLLAQGYMPAQEFHLLKNPAHAEDPWYYEEEIVYPLRTPEYSFSQESLRHPVYLDE